MKIGIILDNPQRDLGGITLLSYHLTRQGYEVHIVPMYDQGYDVPLLGLDCVVVNYARTSNLEFLKSYKRAGLKVFVLDTEGGVLPAEGRNSPSFWAGLVRSIGAAWYIDDYLFWGESSYEAFRKYSGIPSEHLHLTGCPRYDLCNPKWRGLLSYDKKGYILINLNFPSINPWWGKTYWHAEDNEITFRSYHKEMENNAKVTGVNIDDAIPVQEERIALFKKYVAVIAELAVRNRDKQFVIRPHPFENTHIYEALFSKHDNVDVDRSGEVFGVIHHAEHVIHLNCSTAVETRLLGKVPLSLEFLNSEVLQRNLMVPSVISYPVSGQEELNDVINGEKPLPSGDAAGEAARHIYPWYYRCDGKAAERVAEVVGRSLEASGPRRGTEYSLARSVCFSQERPQLKHLVLGSISQVAGSRAVVQARNLVQRRRAMKYVTAEALQEKIDAVGRHEGERDKFKVEYARHPVTGMKLATLQVKRA